MSDPAPPPLPPPAPAAGGPRTSALAIVSLVAGLLGWSVMPVIGSLVAIITGHLARSEVRRSSLEGDGLAVAGLVLGYAMFAVAIMFVFAILLFFGGLLGFITLASVWG